ncbi:hypothetical protein KIK84_01680 [Curvibacter sp. CHRR-16]|uniref:hypothetical protein n=1 Tax=Curvibacter sp. CHRR-16 TaxID=2835872 RepID=UPI001BDA662E|nr:hypothetical protein [Curvibacter sp. CHRR-16]MBT0569026.1 hypothetical protein [Curvibacter sp. CHRR-16]
MQHHPHRTVARTSAVVLAACSLAAQAQAQSATQPIGSLTSGGHAEWALLAMADTDCNDSLRNVGSTPITLNSPCLRKASQNLRSATGQESTEEATKPRSNRPLARTTPVFSNWFQGLFR